MSFKYKHKANNGCLMVTNSSPRVSNGFPRGGGPESPRSEIGEIDTRAPFQSVKAAVSLFGEVAFSKDKPLIRRSKHSSSENVLNKETQLVLAQNELNKLKEHLNNVETTKARVVSDLERAKRTQQDLSNKLNSINASKQFSVQTTEDVKEQVMQLEATQSRSPMKRDGAWKQNLDSAKEQYMSIFAELDASKQQLTKIRQDFDAALEEKFVSFEQAADARYAVKSNTDRISELSKEVAAILESRSQVMLATDQTREEHARILKEKNIFQQCHKTAMEKAGNKLAALKKEINVKSGEEKLAETAVKIEALQKEMKKAHASDAESVRIITWELNDATKTLHQVAEEESVLRNLVESLKHEAENVRIQQMKLTAESVVDELQLKLEESKVELEKTIKEGAESRKAYDDMILHLQAKTVEIENAKKEATEVKKNAEELKREAESASIELEEAEKKVPIAAREVKDAEVADKIATDEIRILSERTDALRTSSHSGSSSLIKMSSKEFEALSHKSEESENLVRMKLAAAKAQLAAINSCRNEADKMFKAKCKEIEGIKAETEVALKQAEMADMAKKTVEGELRRWRQQEKKKNVEVEANRGRI